MSSLRIGLTGGIGTGKSSVAALLEQRGAKVVSGDQLGRIALEQSPDLLAAVRKRFGNQIFTPDGKLLRRDLGKRVFSSLEHVKWLTELTFPRIHELWIAEVRNSPQDVVVFDAALIVEWGMEKEFDYVIAVAAAPETILARLAGSGRLSAAEIAARQLGQADPARKSAVAHIVIQNSGSLADLERQVAEFWQGTIEPELQNRRAQQNAPSE